MDEFRDILTTASPILLFLLLPWLFRKFRGGQKVSSLGETTAAKGLLTEVNKNLDLVGQLSLRWKKESFKLGRWQTYGGSVTFLPDDIHTALTEGYAQATTVNEEIMHARRSAQGNPYPVFTADRMQGRFLKAKDGLESWLTRKMLERSSSKSPLG
jgi:hypothetical protein